ncbi:hypothetical protein RB195_018631 [Necator americanus]|uniref:Uncharacterized protein n=1 Tax=Necator americanus TaxID=51031 RepID=A0ABR1CAM3_NECAM
MISGGRGGCPAGGVAAVIARVRAVLKGGQEQSAGFHGPPGPSSAEEGSPSAETEENNLVRELGSTSSRYAFVQQGDRRGRKLWIVSAHAATELEQQSRKWSEKEVASSTQQDRDNEWTSRSKEFEKAWEGKNPRKAYALLKQYSGKLERCSPVLNVANGVAVGEATLPIWKEHFKTLLNPLSLLARARS